MKAFLWPHLGLTAFAVLLLMGAAGQSQTIDNPYEDVEWSQIHYLHSMSHQHHGRSSVRRAELYEMGFRHFAFSLYYPSMPIYPLPDDLAQHEDVIGAPNTEQHSATDHRMHFNTLGSFYTTGYGHHRAPNPLDRNAAPIEHTFTDLNMFDPSSETPGEGVYFLHIRLTPADGASGDAHATLTVEGAEECDSRTFQRVDDGRIVDRELPASYSRRTYFRIRDDEVTLRLEYDPDEIRVSDIDVRQGLNRPWRQAFAEALDGDRTDDEGRPVEGLLYPDGGGITINHPNDETIDNYLQMLDFDDRVLGIEVWNHRRYFGYTDGEPPHMMFYDHWDAILSTGRRCLGFFVKDHHWRGRGRNILLVPEPQERTEEQRERDALVAYRRGSFFGLVAAPAVDDAGEPELPWDYSEFRFTDITLERDDAGDPVAVTASVDGHDAELRPNLQFRFITEQGVSHVVDGGATARYELPHRTDGTVDHRYVRIEVYAYPDTHLQGEPLERETFTDLNVYEISRLHDHRGDAHRNIVDEQGEEPVGIVDMMYSQPIRFVR